MTPPTQYAIAAHADTGRGEPGPLLLWRFAQPVRAISSGILGGGITLASWVINAHVRSDYDRMDPEAHLREIAAHAGLDPSCGTGLLTAASVEAVASACVGPEESPVRCDATVGVSYPTWAADGAELPSAPWRPSEPTWSGLAVPPGTRRAGVDEPARAAAPWRPGTINLVCQLPVPLTDSALVGAVITATEAKTQALIEGGLPGTGTASDAVVICCPATGADPEPFGGPRSAWGSLLAQAVHRATADGLAGYISRHP